MSVGARRMISHPQHSVALEADSPTAVDIAMAIGHSPSSSSHSRERDTERPQSLRSPARSIPFLCPSRHPQAGARLLPRQPVHTVNGRLSLYIRVARAAWAWGGAGRATGGAEAVVTCLHARPCIVPVHSMVVSEHDSSTFLRAIKN